MKEDPDVQAVCCKDIKLITFCPRIQFIVQSSPESRFSIYPFVVLIHLVVVVVVVVGHVVVVVVGHHVGLGG